MVTTRRTAKAQGTSVPEVKSPAPGRKPPNRRGSPKRSVPRKAAEKKPEKKKPAEKPGQKRKRNARENAEQVEQAEPRPPKGVKRSRRVTVAAYKTVLKNWDRDQGTTVLTHFVVVLHLAFIHLLGAS